MAQPFVEHLGANDSDARVCGESRNKQVETVLPRLWYVVTTIVSMLCGMRGTQVPCKDRLLHWGLWEILSLAV